MGKKEPIQGTLFPELEVTPSQKKDAKKKTSKQEYEEKIKKLEKENALLKEKADAFDELMSSNSLFTTTVVAKSFGKSAIWLNQYLKDKKVQYQQGDVWVLYSRYQSKGYTRICWYEYSKDTKGRSMERAHSYWTAKGVLFIREILKKDGIIE